MNTPRTDTTVGESDRKGMDMKTEQAPPRNVDEYIAGFPRAVQAVLRRVRHTIRKAVPGAEEGISYKMPVYRTRGRPVLYFAGWKQHYSIYPSTDPLVAALGSQLAPYEISKGTIRFPLDEPVPVTLIAGIAKFRAKEVIERDEAKTAAPKKRRARAPATVPARRTRRA